VHALDLRNHGESPHDPSHTLTDMAGDVTEWLEAHGREPAFLMGHSMGGHVAMAVALQRADLVAALVVVDIAPRAYADDHAAELDALSVDVSRMSTRAEVDEAMAVHVRDAGVRQFLQMNLERAGEGFRWKINVEALRAARVTEQAALLRGTYRGPALFLAAGRSSYVTAADHPAIRRLFPAATIRVIEEADHWVHASAPERFRADVAAFLAAAGAPGAAAARERGQGLG
jgi:pimeloyl-ACP methyl ester carboxylesterase